jgi:hypothetical protein
MITDPNMGIFMSLPRNQHKAVREAIWPHKSQFEKYFNTGLAQGKKRLIASLNSMLKDRSKLAQVTPGANQDEMHEQIRRRKVFLETGA